MATKVILYTKYHSFKDFGGYLDISKFKVKRTGITKSSRISVEFEGEGSVRNARMYLDPELAVPLARNLLNAAEGYVSEVTAEIS